ncbi:hypothetical protein B484DRAFT_99769, partial [Ochromonadaceae sp. CCMP2298]
PSQNGPARGHGGQRAPRVRPVRRRAHVHDHRPGDPHRGCNAHCRRSSRRLDAQHRPRQLRARHARQGPWRLWCACGGRLRGSSGCRWSRLLGRRRGCRCRGRGRGWCGGWSADSSDGAPQRRQGSPFPPPPVDAHAAYLAKKAALKANPASILVCKY